MPWFKPSDLYRTDLKFSRYMAHPLTAMVHLSAAASLGAYLCQRPAPDISTWLWWAFALSSGVWLFITGFMYLMMLVIRLLHFGGNPEGFETTFPTVRNTWPNLLFRRELLSAVALILAVPVCFEWHINRPFDQDDFTRCMHYLGDSGRAELAQTLLPSASHRQLWEECVAAHRADKPAISAVPTSPEELFRKYKR